MRRSQSIRMAAGVFVTSLAVLLFRFLVPRPIGVADNGDGWRLLCKLGGGRGPDVMLERYVRFVYQPTAPCDSDYVSSQMLIDWPMHFLGRLFGGTAALDLYLVGTVCSVLAALGIAMIVVGLRVSRRWQVISAALLLLVAADSAFFGYFASVLSEGAAFIGILFLVGGLLLMQRDDRWRFAGTALTVVGALIAVNAKTQLLVLLPLLIVALLFVRQAWVLRAAVMLVVGVGTVAIQLSGSAAGDEYRGANAYHTIFDSIVDGKHDTRGDLAALGLPESYAQYVGTTWWSPRPAHQDPTYPQYAHLVTQGNVLKYYVTHPWRTLQILQQAATDQLTARAPNLGSFGESSGQQPSAKEYRVPVLSGVAALAAPLGLFLLVPLWALICWLGWRARRAIAVVVLLLLGLALSQFLLAALAEGIEGVKHQVISLFCVLLAGVVSVAGRDRHRLVAGEGALEAHGEQAVLPDQSASRQTS